MFTPGQIAFIESIVDRRIAQHNRQPQGQQLAIDAKPRYHSIPEIRQLIVENKATLRESLGSEFYLPVLVHELSKLTTLCEGDLEVVRSGKSTYTRWSSQVSTAISLLHWPQCPIVSTGVRAVYRFID